MKFFQSDLFKFSIIVIAVLMLLFVIIDKFVLHAFSMTAELQKRNEALNRKVTAITLEHKRTQRVVEEKFAFKTVECVAQYIHDSAVFLQEPETKRIAANIVKWARKYDVPLSLAVATAQERSDFNPTLIKDNRRGIMLCSSSGAGMTGLSYREIHSIETNIKNGIYELSQRLEKARYGETVLVASDYDGKEKLSDHMIRLAVYIAEFDKFRYKFTKDWFNTVDNDKAIALAVAAMEQEAAIAKAKAEAAAKEKSE